MLISMQKVAKHIATEYTRTAVIAHISQATTGKQEGWGRPGLLDRAYMQTETDEQVLDSQISTFERSFLTLFPC